MIMKTQAQAVELVKRQIKLQTLLYGQIVCVHWTGKEMLLSQIGTGKKCMAKENPEHLFPTMKWSGASMKYIIS